MSSLNTTNIGRIERGLVVMDCVVDVVREVFASIKRGHPEMVRGIPRLLTHGTLFGAGIRVFGTGIRVVCAFSSFPINVTLDVVSH